MKPLRLKLGTGSDIKLSLENLCEKSNINGFILGVVGDLSAAVFQCPNKQDKTFLGGKLEIITLNGSLSPDFVHLHLSISDTNCQVWGGHLEKGSIVSKGVDILIAVLSDVKPELSLELKPELLDTKLNSRLEIATLPDCPWSAKITGLLDSSKTTYKNILVKDDNDFNIIKERSGSSTFPQVFIDGEYIGGYTEFLSYFSSDKHPHS